MAAIPNISNNSNAYLGVSVLLYPMYINNGPTSMMCM